MFLVDIGNRYAHLFDGELVVDLSYNELIKKYSDKKVYYINVNPNITKKLESIEKWINLEPYVKLDGSYKGMGIDRQVLLKSKKSGLFIDAGSAITIDLKSNNKFLGGTILPGIWKIKESYKDISLALEIDEIEEIDLSKLPNSSTKMSISYGIIAPIVSLVKSINKDNLPIYCCGGDGHIFAKYLDAEYDKLLVFKGMKEVIKESRC